MGLRHPTFGVVLREDTVRDDIGGKAVFTEDASASQVTAAKILNTRSRLQGRAGEANAAVSWCTQIKMKDVPTMLKRPAMEWIAPQFGKELPRHHRPANRETHV